MVVLLVRLEVLGQVVNAGREQRHLDFRGTGVVGNALEFFDDLVGVDGHWNRFSCDAKSAGTPGWPVHRVTRRLWERSFEPRNCTGLRWSSQGKTRTSAKLLGWSDLRGPAKQAS